MTRLQVGFKTPTTNNRKSSSDETIKAPSEAASGDINTTVFPKTTVNSKDGLFNPSFNVDETGYFFKNIPSRTYNAKEEKSMPGFIL